MRLRFGTDLDGGAWPDALAGRAAVVGEDIVGPLGLLGALETALGLGGEFATASERVAELTPRFADIKGYWDASAERDPLGSARELLRWRDLLVGSGWNGDAAGMPARVAALAQITEQLPPGHEDRVSAVATRLVTHAADFEHVECLDPIASLARVWRLALERLSAHGTEIIESVPKPTRSTTGDLAAAKSRGFAPNADGSLLLLRPDGPWSAAEQTAAWLAAQEDLDGTVIVSPSALLDAELRCFGLPTTGARDSRGGGPLLEVLPLVLALAWSPADPQDAAELLSLAHSPVPGALSYRLLGALDEWPAVGSPDWLEAIARGLESIPDERRDRVAARVDAIFSLSSDRAPDGGLHVDELRSRADLVRRWLRGRRTLAERESTGAGQGTAPWDEALGQVAAFERLVDLTGVSHWTECELHRVLDDARATLASERVHDAQAGLACVSHPGAIVGPARRIVWWDFSRNTPEHPLRIPFTSAERADLASHGIELPDPGTQALDVARRFRRPLEQATGALLLVSPRHDEAGDESFAHPLWDEVTSRVSESSAVDRIVVAELPAALAPATVERTLAPLPMPQRHWQADPAALTTKDRLSHSQLATLLGCPLQWTLDKRGRLRPRGRPDVEIQPLVLGKLAHVMLEQVAAEATSPDDAKQRAHAWLDTNGARHAAGLYLPGREAERERVRRILGNSAQLLASFLEASGLHVEGTEMYLEGTGLGRELHGYADLILGPRPMVIDAKWGGANRRRELLRTGTATQLAFYAQLLSQQAPTKDTPFPDVGFLILSEQDLLTNQEDATRPARSVDGPALGETWLAMERAYDARRAELAAGQLEAPAVPDAEGDTGPDKDALLEDGTLETEPGCRYCSFHGICGASDAA